MESDHQELESKRNNNILKLLKTLEKNPYLSVRQELINLLDDEFKPHIIEVSIQKNDIIKTI